MDKITNRREFLKTVGRGATVGMAFPHLLSFLGCAPMSAGLPMNPAADAGGPTGLPFRGIAPSSADEFLVSPDFSYSILMKWGDPLNAAGQKFGFNNDYIHCIPVKPGKYDDMILWVNHEYPHPLIQNGYNRRHKMEKTMEQVEIEMDSMGGSLVRIRRGSDGLFHMVPNDPLNRRIHGRTPIPFVGGNSVLGSKKTMGMVSNCAGGYTPWGTVLTCEENYQLFYGHREHGKKEIDFSDAQNLWYKFYPNPPEHYGWVVEVEPFTGKAKKHVSMGRMAHECATIRLAADGRPVAYTGDDVNDGCLYKMIADKKGSLETGTLYVADTKNGRWIPLDIKKTPVLRARYASQMEVLIDARAAGRLVGGTLLDRPEDIEIHPHSGAVIAALTNNKPRGVPYGSLLKIEEKNNDPLSLEFTASTFIAGGPESGFSCPDNLEFDQNGNLWFTTDISDGDLNKDEYAPFKNNGLFVLPVQGPGAGRAIQVASAPVEAELTGPKFAPDYKSLFLSVQHPGGDTRDLKRPTSRWPDGGDSLPKPSVVEIRGEALTMFAKKA